MQFQPFFVYLFCKLFETRAASPSVHVKLAKQDLGLVFGH